MKHFAWIIALVLLGGCASTNKNHFCEYCSVAKRHKEIECTTACINAISKEEIIKPKYYSYCRAICVN